MPRCTAPSRLRARFAQFAVLAALCGHAEAQQLPCVSGEDAIQRRAFSTALSHLTRCLEIKGRSDRDVSAALQMRASAHSQTGNPLRAVEDYRRSLELLPPSMAWDLLPLAIYLREAGKHAESLEVLQRVLALDEDGPGSGPGGAVYFHLGWTLHELRRFVEAVDAYRKGIAKQPRFEGLYARRALAHDALGDTDRARADLVRAIAIGTAKGIDPNDAPDEYRNKFVEYGLIK